MEQKSEATPPNPPNSQFFDEIGPSSYFMQQTAFILSLALAVKTSLLSHLAEGLMKTLWYLALYLIQVVWMKFVFPSHLSDKGFTTTSAYY